MAFPVMAYGQTRTILQGMETVKRDHKVYFIYDATLNLNVPYRRVPVEQKSLKEALRLLFDGTNICYRKRGKNIMLWSVPKEEQSKSCSVGGLVSDRSGEPVINASVSDLGNRQVCLTDERGRYTLHLPPGTHTLTVSYMGSELQKVELVLHADTLLDFSLETSQALPEVDVVGDKNSAMLTTQTGKHTFTAHDIHAGFSLLSSPDVIKMLQHVSGVTNGVEATSGLFVHGGCADENLFLLDGTPLYQTNHSLGLFSAFNSDIIKNIDFYKSGFPARYSGRISSITDVRTRNGDMQHTKGTFSLGLIDGRLQVEGPIVKGRTSFNFALRRSWLDILSKPLSALVNSGDEGEKYSFGYAFSDLNAKITHRLSQENLLWASVYVGRDRYSIRDKSTWSGYVTDTNNRLLWGNVNATVGADLRLSKNLYATLAVVTTYSHSQHDADEDDTYHYENGIVRRFSLDVRTNHTQMYDAGGKIDFRWNPSARHRIRFGGSFTHHLFKPQTTKQSFYYGDPNEKVDTTFVEERNRTASDEATLYVEDEFRPCEKLSVGMGCSYTLLRVHSHSHHLIDPRLAVKYQITDAMAWKVSYTHMSQSIHRISSTFLELPVDFYVPTTARIKPTQSHQVAGGLYADMGRWSATIEGFYKQTERLLQYRNWMGIQPSAARWEQNVTEGSGRAYGVETDIQYGAPNFTASLAYTLSWSKRRFPELYDRWFYDQFDNRHKVDITVRYKPTDRLSLYAAWTLHSGNRMTLPVGYAPQPQMPDESGSPEAGYIYSEPNNFTLPAYHRLDLGADLRQTTKRGRERIWNFSLYNAYCHLNTMYVKVLKNDDGTFSVKSRGYIPIIPSVSYTLKF